MDQKDQSSKSEKGITSMHHRNRTPHDETTRLHLASSRSKFRQEDQRLAGEQAMRDYKAAEIEQERKIEKLRELRLRV
jgi:hypothetical protein